MVRFDRDHLHESLDPDRTALIVVDMINEFVAANGTFETPAAREMVPQLQSVIESCRAAGSPVVFLKQTNRPGGVDAGCMRKTTPEVLEGEAHRPGKQTDIYGDLGSQSDDIVIEKHQYDGFHETELDTVLRGMNVSTVAITGVATHICCDSTMRGAFFNGYDVFVLEDCNAAFDIPDQGWGEVPAETINQVWLSTVASNFGDVLPSEQFCKKIAEQS